MRSDPHRGGVLFQSIGLAAALSMLISLSAGCPEPVDADDSPTRAVETSASTPAADATRATIEAPRLPATSDEKEASPETRDVFFGDLHVHSSWSLDAYAAGVEVGPRAAYDYAQGKAIPHLSGESIQLAGPPLDFFALTDHAEYLGLTVAASYPDHPILLQSLVRSWLGDDLNLRQLAWDKIMTSYSEREGLPALMQDAVVIPAWRGLVQLANLENQPGRFTSFVGFEYSSNPEGQNLHRNVIFRGGDAPDRPFSSMDSSNPEDLWDWMDEVRAQHGDLIAISHNANGSNGLMFSETRFGGSDIDTDWAAQRARNEPVAEAIQIKGQSETHPQLSPADAWADFEIADWRTTRPNLPSEPRGSYVRDALLRGLAIEARVGVNPYALGMVGSTDGHNASSPFEERNYTGKIGRLDATPEARLALEVPTDSAQSPFVSTTTRWSAAGLAAIWAEANTREALFAALRRREAYATSGPRIRVRLFAGWDFGIADLEDDLGRVGYAKGVPMGGTLLRETSGQSPRSAPVLVVAAQRDPLEATLERVQVVKGWWIDGVAHERVFDVACAGPATPHSATHRCPNAASAPDLSTCEPALGDGASQLTARWQDPEYEPRAAVFYYVRVLQIPTCRWSTFDALELGRPLHPSVPAAIQERAVTSPIWVPAIDPGSKKD